MSLAPRPGCEERCPACRYREVSYAESLAAKENFVREKLAPWSSVMEGIRGAPNEGWEYRRSVFLHTELIDRGWVAGMIRRFGRDEELIPIPGCPLHVPGLNEKIAQALGLLSTCKDLPLFGVMVRGPLLTAVIKARRSEEGVSGLRDLNWARTGFSGVFVNFHPSAGDRVLFSKGWVHLWGEEVADGHGPSTFAQQIPELHRDSIEEASRFFARPEAILDLYSGVGTTLARWGEDGCKTLGVELGRESVSFARRYAEVLEGKVSERLPQLENWVREQGRFSIYANPSRLGLEPEVTEWISRQHSCERMVYLSCSPGTLSRDLESLDDQGWEVVRAIPYDFIPRSGHVEVQVHLKRS